MRALRWLAAALSVVVSSAALALGAGGTAPALADVRAGGPQPPTDPEHSQAALQEVLDRSVAPGGVPGALAGVWQAGHPAALSAGVADLRTGRPPRADMHFRIGSITKTFVATTVLQLVAEGRLRLSDTVDHWLPGLIDKNGNDGNKITVRMLLNHTSGLYNYIDAQFVDALYHDRFHTYTPRELVEYAVGHPPDFPPGTSWHYSNTNYILLGMIIRTVSGHSYADEITRRILLPLKLRNTSLPGASSGLPAPFVHSYYRPTTTSPVEDFTLLNPSWAGAAGEMISTVGDLIRFDSALLGGRLLPPALLRQMLTPVRDSNLYPGHGPYRYGLGVEIVRLENGVTVYGHTGDIIFGSLSSLFATRPGQHVLATNLNGNWINQADFTDDALEAEFTRVPDTTTGHGQPAPRGPAPTGALATRR